MLLYMCTLGIDVSGSVECADHGGGGDAYSTGNGPHGSSWEPTPHQGQEGGFRHDQGDYEQPEWRRHSPEQPSGGSWAQVPHPPLPCKFYFFLTFWTLTVPKHSSIGQKLRYSQKK